MKKAQESALPKGATSAGAEFGRSTWRVAKLKRQQSFSRRLLQELERHWNFRNSTICSAKAVPELQVSRAMD
jgi:hypothetical protein